jgi:hypothetical protein
MRATTRTRVRSFAAARHPATAPPAIRLMAPVLAALAVGALVGAPAHGGQRGGPAIAMGVRYEAPADPGARRRVLEEMQRLHFTVVALRSPGAAEDELFWIAPLLEGLPAGRARWDAGSPPAVIDVRAAAAVSSVTLEAWSSYARGAGGVLFHDWAALQANARALSDAVEFAGQLTRNAALYATLRPREGGDSDVRVTGAGGAVEATFLESADAVLFVAANRSPDTRTAELQFSPATPEAIWQNMLTGTSVNFVAGPQGPTYSHTFAPHDVLVLMIRTKWR